MRAYLTSIHLDVEKVDPVALEGQCVGARAHVARLGAREESQWSPIGEHLHLMVLRSEPTFVEHLLPPQGARFVWIELGSLVACQPRVDWDHVERLTEEAPREGDLEGLLRFCMPLQREAAVARPRAIFKAGLNAFGWIGNHPDVRIGEPGQGELPGTGRELVGFSIGTGLRQMSVVSFNGRHMLRNGYHRAVALARAGHERVPVIFVDAPALEQTPPSVNGMFSPSIVFGPTPPRIVDFLGPAVVEVPTKRVRFLYLVRVEQHVIPG
jgi:hypothetical protein